jgi:TolB-like protein/DNA-binding winged helix-turn-helix (wHTH) protein/Tfp pilus assembly protein PilF
MSTPSPYDSIVRFSVYELDFPGRVLRKSGLRLRCQEQPLQVLAALLEKPGVLVPREELCQRVWPQDTFVDFDHALNTAVKKLRHVLHDDADSPRFIETVPRRGYRFIGPIQSEFQPPSTAASLTAPPPPHVSTDSSPPRYGPAILAGTIGFVFIVVAAYYFNSHRARASGTPSASQPAMLAILPFQNMTSDPAQEFFSDGMTEETTTRLARLNSSKFHVIARTSAMKYKDVRKSVAEIARELHADYLLEGSIRREGPRIRISCQLIRAVDQSPSWSQEYDFDSGDPLSLETNVAETIAAQLNSILGDPAVAQRPVNENALDSYLRGLAESSFHTPEGLSHIITTFEKAAADDPDRAQAFASLAHVYERGANLGFLQPRPAYAKARAAAERAIQLDPSLPESHVYVADAMLTIDYDWKGAGVEIRKALELNVSDPMAHEWNGIFLAIQNKQEPALQEMLRAVELDPLNADRKIFLAHLLESVGRRLEAEEQLKTALQLDPGSVLAHSALICLYTSLGKQADAISEWGAYFSLQGQLDTATSVESVYRKSGFDVATRFALKEKLAFLTGLRDHRYVSPFSLAMIHAQLGETGQAIFWLQKSYQLRDVELPCLSNQQNDTFASVKSDPRVLAIVNKIRPPQ